MIIIIIIIIIMSCAKFQKPISTHCNQSHGQTIDVTFLWQKSGIRFVLNVTRIVVSQKIKQFLVINQVITRNGCYPPLY